MPGRRKVRVTGSLTVVAAPGRGADPRSPLAREIGSKGYHTETFADGPFPLE